MVRIARDNMPFEGHGSPIAFRARSGAASQSPAIEYEVKAAYLLYFGKFIKYPSAVAQRIV
jgi:hypothetical protein